MHSIRANANFISYQTIFRAFSLENDKRDDRVFIDIGNGMFDNIVNRRDRFEKSMKKSAKQIGGYDPCDLLMNG